MTATSFDRETVYERIPLEVVCDLEDKRRYQIILRHGREGEDENGYYTLWEEQLLPGTYCTRRLASHVASEHCLAGDGWTTARVVEVQRPGPITFTRAQAIRLCRKARIAAKRVLEERCDCGRLGCRHRPNHSHHLAF